jgi:hypothetical protein
MLSGLPGVTLHEYPWGVVLEQQTSDFVDIEFHCTCDGKLESVHAQDTLTQMRESE